jgi:hypothetical protein
VSQSKKKIKRGKKIYNPQPEPAHAGILPGHPPPPVAQGGAEEPPFITIPPVAETRFFVSAEPHEGQGTFLSRSPPVTSSSKKFSHLSHLYS